MTASLPLRQVGQSSTTQMLYSTNELIQQDCPTLSGLYVPPINAGIPMGVTEVTEVTEAMSQSEQAIEPSPLIELSPVTEHSPLEPINLSDPPIGENHSELASEIPDEHRESVAEVCAWIELLLPDGGQALGEIMALIKEVFASVPEARGWIWRSLSESVKQLLWQLSPDECGWLIENDLPHSV